MAMRPRFTEQLPVQMTPEMRSLIRQIAQHDVSAGSEAGAARILLELGAEAYKDRVSPVVIGEIREPHSRACGARVHPHGSACSDNCPTCGGVG